MTNNNYENALQVLNLSKNFNEFKLDDVSFTLPAGYIMGLVGKNGAGKTTTINLILDLIKKDSGVINIFDENTEGKSEFKDEIATVFDDTFFSLDWTAIDIEKAIGPFYSKWDSNTFHSYLKQFSLSSKKKVKELSKGMKMKMMLAVALSHDAKLLILDEPTSGLDPVARDELMDILLDYMESGEASVLFSTHITDDLEKIADYITLMKDGKVFYTGPKDDLVESYFVVQGKISEIYPEFENIVIGLRKTSIGFSCLMNIRDIAALKTNMVTEKATIDDILIYINK